MKLKVSPCHFPIGRSKIPKFKELWAKMDSNHRTPKRADLQSAAVGHLAIRPDCILELGNWEILKLKALTSNFPIGNFKIPKFAEPLVGIEPTTY
jgi:hypothetical protein